MLVEVCYYLSEEILYIVGEALGEDADAVLEQAHRTLAQFLELGEFCEDLRDDLLDSFENRAEGVQLD